MVEVKSKRKRPSKAPSHQNQKTALEDLPGRDNHEVVSRPAYGTVFEQANRVFGAFASSTLATAGTISELASAVFAPRIAPTTTPVAETLKEQRPEPTRILQSLDAVEQEAAQTLEGASTSRPARSKKRAPKSASTRAARMKAPAALVAAPEEQVSHVEPPVEVAEVQVRQVASKPTHRRETRVPAGERWKRRRLPKVLW
jgi:hypothetical protein